MTTPRLIENLPFADYLAAPGLSSSFLKDMLRSPQYAKYWKDNPSPRTEAQSLGSALHCLVLEGDKFLERYAILPPMDRRTKQGKADYEKFCAEHPGKEYLDAGQAGQVNGMLAALKAHPLARRRLFESVGKNEASIFWEREGIPCKARLDRIINGPRNLDLKSSILDLKTTQNASHDAFQREILRQDRNYHIQAAWYADGLVRVLGLDPLAEIPVTFIAVESAPPHGVSVVSLDSELMQAARGINDRLFDVYKNCTETGEWPGYDISESIMTCPPWLLEEVGVD